MQTLVLEKLLEPLAIKRVEGITGGKVTGLAYHSGRIRQGNLFFSLEGRHEQGWRYAREAVERGALAAVVDETCPQLELPLIRVPDVRLALAVLANRFYGHPSRKLRLIGVTGTNGKTSTTHMIDNLFRDKGELTGLLGTVGYNIGIERHAPLATTPEASDLQEMLSKLVELGAGHVTMEVSSHALAQHRLTGCRVAVGVFTNIAGEHLDFHRTFDAYLQAKTKLFARMDGFAEKCKAQVAVLNADDPCYNYVKNWSGAQVLTYGIINPADVRAFDIKPEAAGIKFTVISYAGSGDIILPLKGRFNIYNALAAYSVGLVEGLTHEEINAGLASFTGVPGRFELIDEGQDFTVVVDYAHTPDGLENVIKTARGLTASRVITVFGCGGERDRSKRPLMGEVAGRHSDVVIVTDDNPRGEDPAGIVKEIEPGLRRFPPAEGILVINGRREAIAAALETARRGDVVLIAGKGHETEQVYHDRTYSFDDRQVVRELIRSGLKGRGNWHEDERKRDSRGMPGEAAARGSRNDDQGFLH